VGDPRRRVVGSLLQLKKFINETNGKRDCFVSVYDFKYIDKIFIDIDGENAFETAKKIYKFLYESKIPTIPVISGKKGYHLYVLVKPEKLTEKNKLVNATYSIIDKSGAFRIEHGGEYKIPLIDSVTIGDTRRLCRIPETLRPPENKRFCAYLPPDFHTLNEKDVKLYSYNPRPFEYELKKLPSLDSFEKVDIESYRPPRKTQLKQKIMIKNKNIGLRLFLRPCIFKEISTIHPRHEARVDMVSELYERGFDESEIFIFIKNLKWEDFDPEITKYQIHSIIKVPLKPYSCRKLRSLGYCDHSCEVM